ncbi:Crisp [Nesidiocoris tenuis]|uniref:Crisp n=1 Tax=Nesidiocoris tenuis TaxID=355587 RepID=A0ABN7ABX7_9HEMI|nr:Crisp [Nesidiocoris tenuis]
MGCIPFLLTIMTLLIGTETWKHNRIKPRFMGEKVSLKAIQPRYRRVQERIVDLHNRMRAHVQPPSSNMLVMRWDKFAAKAAQKWADRCRLLENSSVDDRWHDQLGACGQNIFISMHRVPWLFALRTWYLEKDTFSYGSHNVSSKEHGHFLQMVWATSHKVGCGLAHCLHTSGKPYYTYVCNYCPIGNDPRQLSRPYRRGRPCGSCPGHCRLKANTCTADDEDCPVQEGSCAAPDCVARPCPELKCSTGRLCTNACPTVDLWSNCKEINKSFSSWLCHTRSSAGRQRRDGCKATCSCKGLIY